MVLFIVAQIWLLRAMSARIAFTKASRTLHGSPVAAITFLAPSISVVPESECHAVFTVKYKRATKKGAKSPARSEVESGFLAVPDALFVASHIGVGALLWGLACASSDLGQAAVRPAALAAIMASLRDSFKLCSLLVESLITVSFV